MCIKFMQRRMNNVVGTKIRRPRLSIVWRVLVFAAGKPVVIRRTRCRQIVIFYYLGYCSAEYMPINWLCVFRVPTNMQSLGTSGGDQSAGRHLASNPSLRPKLLLHTWAFFCVFATDARKAYVKRTRPIGKSYRPWVSDSCTRCLRFGDPGRRDSGRARPPRRDRLTSLRASGRK